MCPATEVFPEPRMGTLVPGERDKTWFDGQQFPEAADKPEVASYGQNMWVNTYENSVTNWNQPRPDRPHSPVPRLYVGGWISQDQRLSVLL